MSIPLDPAKTVIANLGGASKAAEICQVNRSQPYRWQRSADDGGTGGTIPNRHHTRILDYAAANKIDLSAADLVVARGSDFGKRRGGECGHVT